LYPENQEFPANCLAIAIGLHSAPFVAFARFFSGLASRVIEDPFLSANF
jgi:hypothetical protein